MPFSQEKDTFIVMAYYRSGQQDENGEWVYSAENSYAQFLHQFPEEPMAFHVYQQHMRTVISRFTETGSVSAKQKSGRTKVVDEAVVANVQERMLASPKKSLRKLSAQTGKF